MMNQTNFKGSAEITDEGIKKHFSSFDPIDALYELVWNGLDANATSVTVKVRRNEMTGLESISVLDNGEGIDVENIQDNFQKFNESLKKLDDNKHGSHGKGRLAFHRLCQKSSWYTRRENYDAVITINSDCIKDFEGRYISQSEQNAELANLSHGTCVELLNFSKSDIPDNGVLLAEFSKQFGWFLALNKEKSIYIDAEPVKIPSHDLHTTAFSIEDIEFHVSVIRWDDRPSSEKSFNYLIRENRVVHKELSRFNKKIKFYSSAYVTSKWVDKFNTEGMELDPDHTKYSSTYKELLKKLTDYQRAIYNNFLRSHVDSEIERYDQNGYFPEYKGIDSNYADWRKNNTKAVVKEIYLADPTIFNKLNAKQTKILIRLLDKILVSNENDSLFEVLEGVIELENDQLDNLAEQLKRTTLENIISTIEVLQKREQAAHKLREIMENRYAEVLETPDLQLIIENNTWLFGPQYATLGAEEDDFQRIAKSLREKVSNINIISEEDIVEGAEVSGVKRQVDLFLARKVPTCDDKGKECFKCVIVEIKRPGVSLNKKHLQQLEDYAEIVAKHPAFSSDHMRFDLILVGRKISSSDFIIGNRINTLKSHGEQGLVSDGRIKCFVKDWFTILDEFELTNQYLLSNLNTKLKNISSESTHTLVTELQAKTA